MHYKHIHNLAWDLIEATRARLDALFDEARWQGLFIAIGTGDYELAIDTVLIACTGQRIALPPELAERLWLWVEQFGDRDESARRLRTLKSMLGTNQPAR